ncbi:MAG: hypothetical protein ACW98F_16795 [Candidatus Hodarchaeales archaeon]
MDIDYSFLDQFPTYVFTDLISKWQNAPIQLEPNGLMSENNFEKTKSIIQTLSSNRIIHLQKLAGTLALTNVWWQVYQLSNPLSLSKIRLRPKGVDLTKHLPIDAGKITAKFSLIDLCEHALLLIIDFSSRIRSLRDCYRYIYLPSIGKILLEKKPLAFALLEDELLPFLSSSPEKFTSKPIRARLIKKLAISPDDPQHRLNISFLKIRISLETSGIEGLHHIIIEGENVIRGVETLEQRHEISLKFMESGPWVGVGTTDFHIEIQKGVKIHQLGTDTFMRLNTVLNWY